MSTYAGMSERRLYRDKDKAVLGGVCAGLAEYLGFNLKVTRFLAVIAFLCAMPFAVVGYLAAVFLIPSSSSRIQAGVYDGTTRSCARRNCERKSGRRSQTSTRCRGATSRWTNALRE